MMTAHCGDGIESDNNIPLFQLDVVVLCIIALYFCTVYFSLA